MLVVVVVYWVRFTDTEQEVSYSSLALAMSRHFSNKDARVPVDTIEENLLVAAAGADGVYRRAKLVEMVYKVKDEMEELVSVVVFYIDTGITGDVEMSDIAALPDMFNTDQYPAAATRAVVSGVVPGDRDTDWCHAAMMHLSANMKLGCYADR